MSARRTIAALALALGVGVPAARAQTPAPVAQPTGTSSTAVRDSALEARVRDVTTQLRCPVCQGLSLYDSPSELAQEMTGLAREQLRAGKTPAEVRQYFIDRYGEWILLDPQAHGFNWVVYLAPVALLLVGGGVIVIAVKKWSSGGSGTAAAAEPDEEEAETGIA